MSEDWKSRSDQCYLGDALRRSALGWVRCRSWTDPVEGVYAGDEVAYTPLALNDERVVESGVVWVIQDKVYEA